MLVPLTITMQGYANEYRPEKSGNVSLYDNIPKETYCGFTYQDVNMNGEVDDASKHGWMASTQISRFWVENMII